MSKTWKGLRRQGPLNPCNNRSGPHPLSQGTVRVCGDYKFTVNKVLKLDGYPIPKFDDLYTKLAGGQMFAELDLSHTYEQMLVDENSRAFLTPIKVFSDITFHMQSLQCLASSREP